MIATVTTITGKELTLKTFTYYRNRFQKRAFVLADIDLAGCFNERVPRVVLVEWTKTGDEPEYVNLDVFTALVENGNFELFTPTLPE